MAKANSKWLDELPSHWQVRRLKLISAINPSRAEIAGLSLDSEVSFLPMESVGFGKLELSQTRRLEQVQQGFTYFCDGDVLIAKITPSFENGKGAIAENLVNGIGFGTTELHVIRPSRYLNRKFLFYVTLSHLFRSVGAGLMQGTAGQKRVPDDFVKDYPFALPPLDEQETIVAFLDAKTAQIDALIAEKEQQIELLGIKRQALISHAVTKGLNSMARAKDRGIAWSGNVPDNWEVRRLKYIATLKSGESITAEEIEETGEFPVYGGNGLRGYTTSYTHDGNYVLIGRQGALCGNINYASGKFWASEHAVVVTPTIPVSTGWLGEVLRTMNLNQYSVSAAQPGLAVERVRELKIPLPSLEEQQIIASYLDKETAQIDEMAQTIQEQIDLLRTYRQVLITEAVTGKIDVRGVRL